MNEHNDEMSDHADQVVIVTSAHDPAVTSDAVSEADQPAEEGDSPSTADARGGRFAGRARVKLAVGAGAVVVLVGLGALLVADDDDDSSPLPAATASSTTSATTTPRTSPTTTVSTATTVPEVLVQTHTDAAQQLYFAWQRGDEEAAADLATTAAVTAMFDIRSTSAAGLAFVGCTEPVEATSTCAWTRAGARLAMSVNTPKSGIPQVQTVDLS